jgi:hypothetical protein
MRLNGWKPEEGDESAFTLAEIFVALAVLGTMVVTLFVGFSSGLALVQVARENLRATQIMVQRSEDLRLYTWNQVTNSTFLRPTFTDYFYPPGTNTGSAGATYSGVVTVGDTGASIPTDYRGSMKSVTITVFWTNYPHLSTNAIVRTRQLQTFVARYGMQPYVYQ